MIPGLQRDRVDLAGLVARIRGQFPALAFHGAVLNDKGDDHAVVVLDGAWVFRFPRTGEAADYAAGERRLLQRLAPLSPVAIPNYQFVSGLGHVAGYRLIVGHPLEPEVFAALSTTVRARILGEIGGLLKVLHALPIDLIDGPDGRPGPVAWTGADYQIRYRSRRADFCRVLDVAAMRALDGFFGALEAALDPAPAVLIHGDLSADHMLLSPDADHLAGIIDFTDAASGDPAFDFAYLWSYGEDAAAQAVADYGAGAQTAALLSRSRWWHARYVIDQTWRGLAVGQTVGVDRLPSLFAPLGL